jgi:hypothetical protein
MKALSHFAPSLVALALAAGCASTTSTARPTQLGKEKIARPDRIIVYDFAATPADLPSWSAAASKYAGTGTTQTAEQLETGRKLGAEIARQLVAEIQGMGMTAVQAAGQPAPRVGDIVIIGYFGSVDKGSTAERLVLGFGAGSAELKTAVEGYLTTEQGMRQLGSGEVDSGGGKGPGLIVPLVVTAATANPIGLIVSGAVKAEGEVSGRDTIQGAAQRTAKQIGDHLRGRFEEEGWI